MNAPAQSSTTLQQALAELLGTFVLVFFGCGVAVVSDLDLVPTALAFGLALMVMVFALGHISGGHFNPAVTLGAALNGRIEWHTVPVFVLSQLAGALVAGAALHFILSGTAWSDSMLGSNDYDNGQISMGSAFALEALMTLVFVLVVLTVTDPRNVSVLALAPLAIGLALTLVHLLGIRLTGTSVNPARSIGVAVFAGGAPLDHVWLFVAAPLIGALLAGVVHRWVFAGEVPSAVLAPAPAPAAMPVRVAQGPAVRQPVAPLGKRALAVETIEFTAVSPTAAPPAPPAPTTDVSGIAPSAGRRARRDTPPES